MSDLIARIQKTIEEYERWARLERHTSLKPKEIDRSVKVDVDDLKALVAAAIAQSSGETDEARLPLLPPLNPVPLDQRYRQ